MSIDTSNSPERATPSETQISDAVVEAAARKLGGIIGYDFDRVGPFNKEGLCSRARDIITDAIAADREERFIEELDEIESPWRKLVESARRQISDLITSREDIKAQLFADRESSRAEIERLKAERDAAECELSDIKTELSTKDTAYIAVVALKSECVSLRAELDEARVVASIAEEATRKALEAIPVAMDSATEKEREACAKFAETYVPYQMPDTMVPYGWAKARWALAAAIRSRGKVQ
jgi:hypothetical protein